MTERSQTTPNRVEITEEQRRQILRELNRPRSRIRMFVDWAKSLVVAIVLFLLIRTFLVEAFKIPTGSMEHTLLVGDFLLVNKAVYGAEIPFTNAHLPPIARPQRGDIIVFEWPKDPSKNFVKRLIGLPGDTLEMREGVVRLNGKPLDEQYVDRTAPNEDPSGEDFEWQRNHLVKQAAASGSLYHPSRNNWGPLVVPEKSYFVLGDNRDNSYDSRYWGFVPDSLVKGQPFVVYYSYAREPSHHIPWLTNIRWRRLGERVH